METSQQPYPSLTPPGAVGGCGTFDMGKRGEPRRQINARWLTSFGDLLTLLLCFFIAVLSLTREGKINQNGELRRQTAFQTPSTPPGTAIAFSGEGPGLQKGDFFLLSRDTFEQESFGGLIKWFAGYETSANSVVDVVGCGKAASAASLMQLQAGIELAFGVAQHVRFTELGISCEELQKRFGFEASEEVVAAIRVRSSEYGR